MNPTCASSTTKGCYIWQVSGLDLSPIGSRVESFFENAWVDPDANTALLNCYLRKAANDTQFVLSIVAVGGSETKGAAVFIKYGLLSVTRIDYYRCRLLFTI
jgi:hypothetical protein